MKKKLTMLALFASLFLASMPVSAQDSGFGAGVQFGAPTGINIKYWLSKSTALDAGMNWSFYYGGYFGIHTDFLMHRHQLIRVSEGNLAGYMGIGAKLGFGTDFIIGVRVPFGLDYMFDNAPVDIFLEVAPGLDLTPATKGFVEGGIGIRYFF